MIAHLDMDAFFAAVEQLDNPGLRGRPVIIGGGTRGVVATASYEARRFGIHSAMPASTARRLCPHGIFIHGNHKRYSELSRRIMGCLRDFSPVIQPASIDEAYLDLTAYCGTWDKAPGVAAAIQANVADVTGGLTCSIGIAPIKFLAKICSDVNKPNGICVVAPARMDAFLQALPVAKLPGVGRRMQERLLSFGITTVRELRQLSRQFLLQSFGKWGGVLHDRAHGIDPRGVHENAPPKSEGAERTFDEDIYDHKRLQAALEIHSERIGSALLRQGISGRTITLKLKFADFRQITRSRTLAARTNSSQVILQTACALLAEVSLQKPARLIGISVSGFEPRPEQLFLPGCPAFYR